MCISQEESRPCSKGYTTKKKIFIIRNLNAATKYYVCVLASTKVGHGNYSKSKGKFTNGSKCYKGSDVLQFHFADFVIFEIFSSSPLFAALSSSYFNEFVFLYIFRNRAEVNKANKKYIKFHTADSFGNFHVSFLQTHFITACIIQIFSKHFTWGHGDR